VTRHFNHLKLLALSLLQLLSAAAAVVAAVAVAAVVLAAVVLAAVVLLRTNSFTKLVPVCHLEEALLRALRSHWLLFS
jgi:hypothetical protein